MASPSIQNNLLKELSETARKTARNQIKTTAELRGDPISLNFRLADAFLHIGREAIANALGHGDPSILKIMLSYQDGSVELVVEDNGSGFKYSQEKEGFGILGMQKRARSVGSELRIQSTPGQGTQIRVQASLQEIKLRSRIAAALKRKIRSLSPIQKAG